MNESEKAPFIGMLQQTLLSYAKPLPDATMIGAWWSILNPFPFSVVQAAFRSYCDEQGEFAPIPAGIAKRCKLMDGRPSAEEAWAIALTSRDEADTVVWTTETAAAFHIAGSVLAMGDEVGARMAFHDAYSRLIATARTVGKPAQWAVSLGWNIDRRETAIRNAVVANLLPAPAAAALLPNFSLTGDEPKASPEGLQKVKELMSRLNTMRLEDDLRKEQEKQAQRDAVSRRKWELNKQTRAAM